MSSMLLLESIILQITVTEPRRGVGGKQRGLRLESIHHGRRHQILTISRKLNAEE